MTRQSKKTPAADPDATRRADRHGCRRRRGPAAAAERGGRRQGHRRHLGRRLPEPPPGACRGADPRAGEGRGGLRHRQRLAAQDQAARREAPAARHLRRRRADRFRHVRDVHAGTLLEVDWAKVPNGVHIVPALKTKYSVPHIFTSRVILYNPSKVTEVPTSYNDLWNPKYAGRVGIIDIQYQTTIESAAMISGGTLNNYEPGKDKLLELKKLGVKIVPTNEAMAAGAEDRGDLDLHHVEGARRHVAERRRPGEDRRPQGGRRPLHLRDGHRQERARQGPRRTPISMPCSILGRKQDFITCDGLQPDRRHRRAGRRHRRAHPSSPPTSRDG